MEEVAFSDWPGQPVDVNGGNNPWLPAYGFQTPTSMLEKEDFLGNPDAEYFFQGSNSQYMYLETIQEETSDDLRSESDYGSNKSPVGWLATDSESGSVICIDPAEDIDCDSDRELACPAKRRKQDLFLTVPTQNSENPEELDSISRSSSLLQFETLEQQCQENSSPSVFSQFSFDSLETTNQRNTLTPDSLTPEDESDYYKTLKIDIPRCKNINNITRYSFSDSSDSDTTLDGARSFDNLKTWRSFDSLPTNNGNNNINTANNKRDKISAENLSEDSGYSDHLTTKSSSASNLESKSMKNLSSNGNYLNKKKNSYVGFTAYDGDIIQENIHGNFGVSYQDLSIFEKYEPVEPYTNSLIESFLRKKLEKSHIIAMPNAKITNLDHRECGGQSIFNAQSASVPNIVETLASSSVSLENTVCFASSVPKNLNFITEFSKNQSYSVAEKNWNLTDLNFDDNDNLVSETSENQFKMTSYRAREGSYTEAMSNRVDLSDDENSLINKHRKKLPKTTIVDFDRRVLKAISEQSIQSLVSSSLSLHGSQSNLQYKDSFTSSTPRRKVTAATSTPNLNRLERINREFFDEERRKSTQEISRVCEREEKGTQTMFPDFAPLRAKSPEKPVILKPPEKSKSVMVQTSLEKHDDVAKVSSEVDRSSDTSRDLKRSRDVPKELERSTDILRDTKRSRDVSTESANIPENQIRSKYEAQYAERSRNSNDVERYVNVNEDSVRVASNIVEKYGGVPTDFERCKDILKKDERSRYETQNPITFRDSPKDNIRLEREISPERELMPHKPLTPELEEEEEIFLLEGPSCVIQPKGLQRDVILEDINNGEGNDDNIVLHENELQIVERKNSIIKSSTSTSGISDVDEKTLRNSVKSFTGSTGSKGVHFSPVVSEVNWRDDGSVSTATPERESSFSLDSSPEPEGLRQHPTPPASKVVRPKPRYSGKTGSPINRLCQSQPDLSDSESLKQREFLDSLHSLRQDYSKSQPDVSKLKRRGSQMIKKDKDGCVIKAYVDGDGIQYQHTHLDLNDIKSSSNSNVSHQQQQNSSEELRRDHKNVRGGNGNSSTSRSQQQQQQQSNIGARPTGMMEHHQSANAASTGGKNAAKSGKLGGFFQRLASFRFSAKKSAEEKAAKTKKKQVNVGGGGGGPTPSSPLTPPNQRFATKDDYIYIPLKGPSSNYSPAATAPNNNNNSISTKPPLPKQPPPRVVHASIKGAHAHGSGAHVQSLGAHAQNRGPHVQHRGHERADRRRTIDSMEAQPMGLIETDLDTEVTVITSGAAGGAKTRSLLNLGGEPGGRLTLPPDHQGHHGSRRPHKSMEFLLDKENLKVVEPPENELQKGERVMSEHQLRVQRSLQKLTVPEWYKQSQVPREGFLLKKNPTRESRWAGTGNKTTSLSSLGSSNQQSPLVLSPTPCNQSFVRWSTSKLNSTASSPCQSTRSSFNTRQPNGSISPSSVRSSFSYRQPYLGWRSQERLSRPRTPAERLASSLLSSSNSPSCHPNESPEIQTSIKEVTSAIVHYVSGLKPEDKKLLDDSQENISRRSSSVSPRGSQKFCWLESSFVGTKPLDSPQTPVTISEGHSSSSPVPVQNLRLELQGHHGIPVLPTGGSHVKPSPSSTTLEDVLDSLLGLPSSGRAPSPCLQETASASTSPNRQYPEVPDPHNRRRSEGSQSSPVTSQAGSRRVSFDSSTVLRCRYPRCAKTVLAGSAAANTFKNCHNCSFTYCSRACRRAHWEKHRKTCLFSRIGSLCRQVIAASKEQRDTLRHLSKMARRGYISHGSGAVKCFFPNPDAADKFLTDGLQSLGELTFVPWQDLLPSEMGPQLYEEIVKMCKIYNPDSKLVLYVSICVVSETPSSGCVKWERQLVSRCAKMRLSKDVSIPDREAPQENLETLVLTCAPITNDVSINRKIAVENLQKHLKERNVVLKKQLPEVLRQLIYYCENENAKFNNVNVYPKDTVTGKNFMCIIMLEASVESLRKVENAGVKVRTLDVLSEKTAF